MNLKLGQHEGEGLSALLPPGGAAQLSLGFLPFKSPVAKGFGIMGSFADPGANIRKYQSSKDYILGRQPPMQRQASVKSAAKTPIYGPDGRSAAVPNLSPENLRKYTTKGGVGSDSDKKFVQELFASLSGELKQQPKIAHMLEKEARAGLLRRLGQAIRPEIVKGGPRTWSPYLKLPLATAGIGLGTYGVFSGLDYLHDQSRVIGRARAYSSMMKEYGDAISMATARGINDAEHPLLRDPSIFQDFVEDKSRQVFKALYKVAPEIAKEPTLAAGHMASVMNSLGAQLGDEGMRELAEEGDVRNMATLPLHEFELPASMERQMGRQALRPSDVIGGAGKMMGSVEKYSPYLQQQQAMWAGEEARARAAGTQRAQQQGTDRGAARGLFGFRRRQQPPEQNP